MEVGTVSPAHSNNSITEINKSEIAKSPSKCKKLLSGSSTNLDKVIEAVSKGILDECHGSNTELDSNHIEIKPIKSPKMNGVQSKLNDTKSPSKFDKTNPEAKVKASKKSKKEKDKDKEEEKAKDNDEDKQKDMDKVKEKTKVKGKTKRKDKVKSHADTNLPKTEEIKAETLKLDENEPKTKDCTVENSTESMKMDISVSSNNTTEVIIPKETQPLSPENAIKVQNEQTELLNGNAVDVIAPTKTLDAAIERKQSRKRRKEKHRSKHGPDAERSSSKEHKKKRKRKSYDHENPQSFPLADGVPKIKIKVHYFCPLNSLFPTMPPTLLYFSSLV